MPKTVIRSGQIKNQDVKRVDMNTATPGKAVITKLIAGDGVVITWTGADQGTGDVTIGTS